MPPKNRQRSAYAATSTAGQYKASLFDISDASSKMDYSKRWGEWETEKLGRNVPAISDTLEYASTIGEGAKSKQALEGEYLPELEKSRFGKEYKGDLSFEEFKTQKPGEYTEQFEAHEIERNLWDRISGKERMYQFGSGDKAREFKRSDLMAYGKSAKGIEDYKALGMEDYFGKGMGAPISLAEEAGIKTSSKKISWQTASGGLTAEANTKLYGQDPTMRGKSKDVRTARYKELFEEGGGEKTQPYQLFN